MAKIGTGLPGVPWGNQVEGSNMLSPPDVEAGPAKDSLHFNSCSIVLFSFARYNLAASFTSTSLSLSDVLLPYMLM